MSGEMTLIALCAERRVYTYPVYCSTYVYKNTEFMFTK